MLLHSKSECNRIKDYNNLLLFCLVHCKGNSMERKLIRSGNGWALFINSTFLELLKVNPETDKVEFIMENDTLKIKKAQSVSGMPASPSANQAAANTANAVSHKSSKPADKGSLAKSAAETQKTPAKKVSTKKPAVKKTTTKSKEK